MPRGPVRIIPHLREEPDYNALAVAALLLLDQLEAEDRNRDHDSPEGDVSQEDTDPC